MGTRSTVKFYDGEDCICSIYQQYDGYLDGVGKELAEFLQSKKMVNGFRMDVENQANGIGCLAAQYIAENKKGVGGLYLTTADNEQEYNYIVSLSENQLVLKVLEVDGCLIFNGNPSVFLTMLSENIFTNEI